MAALSFLEKHPDDSIGAERPPLNFQQDSGRRRNHTQGTMLLNSKWNLWDNSWGLGDPSGNTDNLPPEKIVPGTLITTGSDSPMLADVHLWLDYEVTDAAGRHLGRCRIDVDSSYPGFTSDTTLSQRCDEPFLKVTSSKDGQESATFVFYSNGLGACPAGLEAVSEWTIRNKSGAVVEIAELAGWNREARQFVKFPAQIDAYLGSDSYKLAASNVRIGVDQDIYVQTCSSAAGSKQPDQSLYLTYRPKPKAAGPEPAATLIGWSGTGKVDSQSSGYQTDPAKRTITIVGGN